MNRRAFIQWLAGLGATLVFKPALTDSATHSVVKQHTRVIPSSGESIPVIGLGSWITFGIDPGDVRVMNKREQLMREFLGRGGGVLDSSPMYGNAEKVIGICLKRIGSFNGLFSATKVWTTGKRNGVLQMERSRLLWGALDRSCQTPSPNPADTRINTSRRATVVDFISLPSRPFNQWHGAGEHACVQVRPAGRGGRAVAAAGCAGPPEPADSH